jgi:predicted alpha/beta superfamily hydrolase
MHWMWYKWNGQKFKLSYILKKEIRNYIKNTEIEFNKISFIGHSLGGIIIRATLPLLNDLS